MGCPGLRVLTGDFPPNDLNSYYGFIVTNNSGAFQGAYLTEHSNLLGQKTRFNYYSYVAAANPVVRLRSVVDCEGGTNRVYYDSTNAYSTNLISKVVDPFGRSTSLAYDRIGRLTTVTDVAGMTSSFVYDDHDWVTNMVTPYGTNAFTFIETPGGSIPPNGRSILVTEPDGNHAFFLYKDSAPGITNTYWTDQVPATTAFTTAFDNSELDLRNSFYWGRLQYAALSTTDPAGFTSYDFQKARLRHWLKPDTNTVGMTLSLERAPSPDSAGSIEGQKTWYDYAGKTNSAYQGIQARPLFVAVVLPDGTTRFTRTERNTLGVTTNEISTYSVPGAVDLRTNTFTYAPNNIDLLRVTNALGIQVSSNYYSIYHQVLTNYNALREMTVFRYDTNQQLASVSRPSGLVTTNLYFTSGDSSNRLDRTIDFAVAEGIAVHYRTNTFTWTNGLVWTHTDPRGVTLTFTWDDLQRLRCTDYPDGTFITNSYDKLDLMRVLDRMGFTNSFGYNAVRQLIASTNANGVVTRYAYCSCGSLESITNAFGTPVQQVTYYYYDNQGNHIQTVGPDGYWLNYGYNSVGQLTNVSDAVSSVTNWYNNQGLLTASFNAFGQASAAIYDILDRATNSVDANGVTLTNTFDNLNRLLTRGYPDGGVERFAYTLNVARATGHTNQLGTNIVNYIYDPLDRKTTEVYPGICTNRFTYGPAGDLLTLTDGKSQVTTWRYDQYGRATNKIDATATEIFRWSFDANGRLTNRWTPESGDTAYAYDAVTDLLTINYRQSTIDYGYDPLGRLTNMVDAVGTTVFGYTDGGQLQSEDGPWANDSVTYTYLNRLCVGMSLAQPSGSTWTNGYSYDTAERLKALTSPAGSFEYRYDLQPSDVSSRLLLPNGAYITNTFDAVARLTGTYLKNSASAVLNSHSYVYDLAGQRKQQTRKDGSYVTYSYDGVQQLETAFGYEANDAPRLHEQFGYSYDAAGNLSVRTNNLLIESFTVGALNELCAVTRWGTLTVAGNTTVGAASVTVNGSNAVVYGDGMFAAGGFGVTNGENGFTAVGRSGTGLWATNRVVVNFPATNRFVYDGNGNLRTNGLEVLEYDDENELVADWVAGVWRSEFVYDGLRRRRVERDYGWSGSSWVLTNETRYVYDGRLPIQHRDGNNAPVLTLTRGLDLSGRLKGAGGVGGLLAMTEGSGAHSYYHADGRGNVTALLNGNQLVVGRYLYDPFGRLLGMSGPKARLNPYRFSSKWVHGASGRYDYGRRWYAPELQRWVNRDPMGERGGLNLYRFANNNGVRFVDREGLCIDVDAELDRLVKTLYDAYKAIMETENPEVYRLAMETEEAAIKELADINWAIYSANASFSGFMTADVGVAWYVAPAGVVGAATTAAAVGAGIGYGTSQLPVIGGGTVADFWGDVLYNLCPDCWNTLP